MSSDFDAESLSQGLGFRGQDLCSSIFFGFGFRV